MLQWMHRISTSWIASLFMGALALSFVVWGIADVFTGMTSTALATVGSTEISSDAFTRSYRNFLRNESQQMGTDVTPEMAQKMGLGNVALQQLLSRTALDNSAANFGLTTPDSTLAQSVRSIPAFNGATGKFDHDTFLRVIQNLGYTEDDFLAEQRSDMTRDQFTTALQQGFNLPRGYAQAIFQFLTEKRAASYVVVAPEAVGPVAPPTDAALADYVKAHPTVFSTPEYRQVEYAQVGPQDVAGQIAVTDAQVAQYYTEHKSEFNVPEKRDIQQIEFATEADAQAARAQIDKGKTFDQLAAGMKIKPTDLDLGTLAKDDLADPPRADAAFALPVNQVSQPVKAALGGYVLMRVTAVTPEVARSQDDAKADIKKTLALQGAAGKIADIINAFEDARSGGADIATAAKKSGMKSGKFAAIDKNGLDPTSNKSDAAPADPEFYTQTFGYEVGEDNDPFQAKSGEYYDVKVDGVTPPKLKALAGVHEQAVAAWTAEQRQQALQKKAAELAAKAIVDKNLAGIAKDMKVPVQQSPGLARNSSDTTFSQDLVGKIFDAAPGGIVEAPQAAGQNFIIAQVTGIQHDTTSGTDFAAGATQLSEQAAGDVSISYANAARDREGVKVNQQMLQSALGQQ
jgi:peptidyl-prolyl cis-trans isomerase D